MRSRAIAGFGLAAAVAASAPLWGPEVLLRLPGFEIEQVEISGTRIVSPEEVLQSSGIVAGRHLWADLTPIESAIRAQPGVEGVIIQRQMPNTLRIRLEEKRPIAYVEAEALSLITAGGEILPVDPTRAHLDLPLLRGRWDRLNAEDRRRLLAETDRLGRSSPALLARTSEIRLGERTDDTLILTHALASIVLPIGATAARLSELEAVLLDLEGRTPELEGPDPESTATVDLRFEEQVVVRIPFSA